MKQKLIFWAIINFFSFVFLYFTPSVFAADVVINEFLVDPDTSQWVELYNKGQSTVDISGWFIDDDGGSQKFTVPASTSINSSEFKVFESSYFNLNRTTPDTIRLLNNSILEDSYSYDSGPGVNKSYGRNVDGTGDWVSFSSSSKGLSNNTLTPIPTSTPIPTGTATPTNSPTPTKTPTSTPTNRPTATPKVTQSPSSTPTPTAKVATPTLTKTSTQDNFDEKEDIGPTSILGEMVTASPSALPTEVAPKPEKSFLNFSTLSIGIGFIFLTVSGILAFRSYKKSQGYDYR